MADERIKKEHAAFDMSRQPFDLVRDMEREFRGHVLPFWKNLKDPAYGGFYGWLDYDLNLDPKAVKGCILNDRILWFFSNAYMTLGDQDSLSYADWAFRFLMDHGLDPEYGGVYWSLHYDGTPDDTTKHTYNQAFAIYALSSYFEASGCEEAIRTAFTIRQVIETRCRDAEGYLEAFTRDFRPAENDKLSENGVIADRTMNTALHILEAYTALVRAGRLALKRKTEGVTREEVRDTEQDLVWILRLFTEKIYNPEKERLEVFFDRDYHSLLDLHSYGHDIEASWLMEEASDVLQAGDTEEKQLLAETAEIAEKLRHHIYVEAFDGTSTAQEREKDTVNEIRVWWVQAESVVGFLNGFQRDPSHVEYRKAFHSIWAFIRNHFIDSRPGSEWFSETWADGTPNPAKAILEPWKCPYHTGRMCFEIMRRYAEMKESGIQL